MIIIKLDNNLSIERALKLYKSKVIKTRQSSELVKRKEFKKPSVIKRDGLSKAKYVQKKFKSNDN
jgi:small subunit ribosomal protein S21